MTADVVSRLVEKCFLLKDTEVRWRRSEVEVEVDFDDIGRNDHFQVMSSE